MADAKPGEWIPLTANNDLIADHTDLHSSHAITTGNVTQHQVLMRQAEKVKAWDGSAGTAMGISMIAATANTNVQFYDGGGFFQHKLVWPATLDTIEKRMAAFDNSRISIRP